MHKVQFTSNSINSQLLSRYMYRVLVLLIIVGLLLISHRVFAADPNPFESSPDSSAGSCPAGHKMYSIGNNTSTATTQPLSLWENGKLEKNFIFDSSSNAKTFNIKFSKLVDITNNNRPEPPFYADSFGGATSSAINLSHDSTIKKTNHVLKISVDRSVSKIGYKIQDLDSTSVRVGFRTRVPYREQVDVSANKGFLTSNPNFHDINSDKTIVTAKSGINCGGESCNINANWNYNLADTSLELSHNNDFSETNGIHTVGYSDFYFCLAPPKLVLKTELNGNRINDTDSKRDQFEIKATGNSVETNSFTTTGKGANILKGSSAVLELEENKSYKVTERVMNVKALGDVETLGDIANYDATYTCTNATTGTAVDFSSGAMTYDATTKARSFTLANINYGDEITCTITNTPKAYTFSGTVFNDNGDITNANADNADITSNTSPYANNTNYFNGIFDITTPQENGISGSTVKLVNCATPSTVYGTQVVSTTGTYQISVPATTINSNSNNICLIEERGGNDYPIRTNNGNIKINITSNTYLYNDNDFGRVIPANAALVLEKEQAPNNCNITSLTDTSLKYSKSPLSSSGDNPDIRPGQCIAYRITATNRANIPIDNFIMQDTLQRKGANNATVTSVLNNPAREANVFNDGLINGQNGTIRTISQTLPKRNKRLFYFNTKYGNTMNAQ